MVDTASAIDMEENGAEEVLDADQLSSMEPSGQDLMSPYQQEIDQLPAVELPDDAGEEEAESGYYEDDDLEQGFSPEDLAQLEDVVIPDDDSDTPNDELEAAVSVSAEEKETLVSRSGNSEPRHGANRTSAIWE